MKRIKITNPSENYNSLIIDVGRLLEQGRRKAFAAVNSILMKTYWEIGKRIVEYEQKGEEKAEYGSGLLDRLSKDLKFRYGKGFSRRNILDMRRFYQAYPKWQTVSAELSWSHYAELLKNIVTKADDLGITLKRFFHIYYLHILIQLLGHKAHIKYLRNQ